MLRHACVAAVLAVVGAGPALSDAWDEAEMRIAACFAAMDAEPALGVVNAKFARRNPTDAQLRDAHRVTDAEADALRLRIAKTRPCRAMRLNAVKTHHPLLEPAYTALYYQADQVFDYLIQGAISYGAANRLAQASFAAFEARSKAYFAASDAQKTSLSAAWLDELQRAHSEPPPPAELAVTCSWRALNIVCQ